jgi:ligand-binding sensor domain-containing protein
MPMTQKVKLRYLFSAIVLLWTHVAFSQFLHLQNYNVKNGLPGSEIYTMIQDSSGYLWFAGDMGVSRFDGYHFQNYTTEDGLPNNSIIKIYQDHKGRIWFISLSSALSYYEHGHIYTLACNDTLEKLLGRGTRISSVYTDIGDTIWIGHLSAGILKIAPGWKPVNIEHIDLEKNGGYIFQPDHKGFVFGSYHNKSDSFLITVYSRKGKEYVAAFVIRDSLANRPPIRICASRLTDNSYLFSLDNYIIHLNAQGIISVRKEDQCVLSMLPDKNTLLIGTYGGVRMYSYQTGQRSIIRRLEHKSISAICRDHENGLWFSTDGQGVYYVPFRNIQYYTIENGLPESRITSVEQLNGKLLLGHLNATVSVLDKQNISSLRINKDIKKPFRINSMSSLLRNKNGLIYGGANKIYRIDTDRLCAKEITDVGAVKKMINSRDGNVWVLTHAGVTKCDASFKVIQKIPFLRYADNLFEDSRGKLWICAINGLWVYNDSSGVLDYMGTEYKLLASRIVDIKETPGGSLWMAGRGAGVIIKRGSQLINLTQKDGLAGNMCKSLYYDEHQTMWVGTNNGLSAITETSVKDSFSIKSFFSKNGLLSNEVNQIVALDNKLWLIHNTGISVVHPNDLINNTTPPPVYITGINVNNDTLSGQSLYELKHDQNFLTLSYIGLSFKDPGNIEYKYKMEGIDSGWNYTTYTSVKYQALQPGTYRFIVYARNNDGYWNEKPAEVSFKITPAWWQTWAFRFITAALIFGLILIIFILRLKAVKKRGYEKLMIARRIEATELKALRAQMNPHFIFNVINSVQYFITNNDAPSSQKYLSRFGRLIRYVLDNSKPASIPLEQEVEALRLYLQLEALRFENQLEYHIITDPAIEIPGTYIPSMLIQPYVENAIWHGIMHKKGQGRIIILLQREGNNLKCIIEDNGIGRERSKELSAHKHTTHQSSGMSITRERLEIINHINNSNLTVKITDLKDENGLAAGTRVEITIPQY